MAKRPAPETRIAADNRKARFNYAIESSLEAGIELFGTEVKALREGKANIGDAYATPKNGELLLMNSYIAEYGQAGSYFQPAAPQARAVAPDDRRRASGDDAGAVADLFQ